MAEFQLLSCNIMLGGDMMNVVARHAHVPVTYPELLVLKYLHGDQSVTDVFHVGAVERDEDAEFARLQETYGAVVREKMFPGAGTRLPTHDERYQPRLVGTLVNPGPAPLPAMPDLPPNPVPADPVALDEAARAARRPTPVAAA